MPAAAFVVAVALHERAGVQVGIVDEQFNELGEQRGSRQLHAAQALGGSGNARQAGVLDEQGDRLAHG